MCAVLVVARAFKIDPDTWWHIVVGQQILSTHSWPVTDAYSFTAAGANWMAYEWLAEVVLAFVMGSAGLYGLLGLLIVLASTITLLTYYYAFLRCGDSKSAFVATALTLPFAGVWFTVHPQLFGYAFLLIVLVCLEHFRQGRRWVLWLLPLVFLLWVNTHGTFVFGFLALGVYWACGLVDVRSGSIVADRWPVAARLQMTWVALVSLLACCVTPYGSRLLTYPLELMLWQHEATAKMTSWQPIPLNRWDGKLFLVYVLIFVVALAALRPTLRLEDLTLWLFAVYMTALHTRTLPLFAIVFAPMLAELLARWIPPYEPEKDQHVLNVLVIAALTLCAINALPSQDTLEETVRRVFPRAAVDYLRQHSPTEPMFNDLGSGGYLLYARGMDHRVFIDGRLDIYAYTGVLSDYFHITELDPNALELLGKYHIQSCLMPRNAPLVTLLVASPEWRNVYSDGVSTLFVRRQVKVVRTTGER